MKPRSESPPLKKRSRIGTSSPVQPMIWPPVALSFSTTPSNSSGMK
jgi:hypothetical protein